jgi:UDP-N-acetylmuramoylalanine--D-glutamate ligase
VVEVSSFQMETTELPSDTFEAAAVLNLQEDHLDRHGSVEVYHALKRKLLTFAKVQIMGTDPESWGMGNGERGTAGRAGREGGVVFSSQQPVVSSQ